MQKKFGAFGGVFTPSILTILGVIMYLRLGWVIGHAGLIGTILIIVIAHVISVSTGLSVSSIATDKKVGAGGIYYILSRSMGIPIGGAIGIALYVGTALSIALYLIGFAESFNLYFGLDTSIMGLRMTGSAGLLILTAIALISTSAAIKTQYFILVAIIVSLVSIFFGTSPYVPETIQNFSLKGTSLSLEVVFAVFFPAVTGFTAGIAMSGDLKDPKKSIPLGTLAAVAVGFCVYIGLAVFIAYNIDSQTLRDNYNILSVIAISPIAVFIGIWGATLSSALGGILGGPRILQAMSVDKITPRIFGLGKGKNNEPVNALLLVFAIAFGGVMIGELDAIASIVSMFYLAAYGFINLSFFLESWANPDFKPTFKVKRWIGLLGFIACFGVMFKLNAGAMFGAIAIIMGIYFWLKRKQIMLSSGDVWQSVWENVVTKGLRKLEEKEKINNKWNPNIILFSGNTEKRPHLLELSKTVAGRTGIVTNFDLVVQNDSESPLPKNRQIIQNDTLDKMGIFGRKVEVNNIYQGVENIASTFGFSGIDPNTIMMGWPKKVKNQEQYASMTQKLIHLDYNLLYLDYDERTKFGNRQSIDVWWRETDNKNAELMLNIVRSVSNSPDWNNCKVRVLFVNHNNVDNTLVKSKIINLIESLRLDAEIKIINNGVEQKSFYDIIKIESAKTDLVLLGLPNVKVEKQAEFILKTNYLFETIGSTLLVKASQNFNEIELDFSKKENVTIENEVFMLRPLPESHVPEIVNLVNGYDIHLSETAKLLTDPGLTTISSFYYQLLNRIKVQFELTHQSLKESNTVEEAIPLVQGFLRETKKLSIEFKKQKLPALEETFSLGISSFINERKKYLELATDKMKTQIDGKNKTIDWKNTITHYSETKLFLNTQFTLYEFGVEDFVLLTKISEELAAATTLFVEQLVVKRKSFEDILQEYANRVYILIESLVLGNSQQPAKVLKGIQNYERNLCISLMNELEKSKRIRKQKLSKKDIEQVLSNVEGYASDWYRNQLLSHSQAETNLDMAVVGLSLVKINENFKNQVKSQIILPEEQKVKSLARIITELEKSFNENNLNLYATINAQELENLAEEIPQTNIVNLLEVEEDSILTLSRGSTIIDLLRSDSYNDLIKTQNAEVNIISLNIPTIQDYIIQSKYLSPLYETMREIEGKYKISSEKLYYAANLIKHLIEDTSSSRDKVDFKEVLGEAKNRITSCQKMVGMNSEIFDQSLSGSIHNTLSDLNVRTILSSADTFMHNAKQPIHKSKFELWGERKKESLKSAYLRTINFIVQRKREIDTLKFDEKYIKYQNSIQRTNQFLSAITVNEYVAEVLPFYYKKLFTGSHLGNAINRKKESAIVTQALQRIDEGVSGAIMILGESCSGKSYFTEHVANSLLKGKKYYINPPFKQKFEVNDLHLAFQETFGQSGTTESILNRIPPNSILIFNDLEEWWMKNSKGENMINYLSKIIEKFGAKHYFLLNSNIYSFDVMRKTTHVENSLLATVIMSPLNKEQLQHVILTRHHTAGVDLAFDEDQFSNNKKINSIITTIHEECNGNIGLALNTWLSSIAMLNDKLVVKKPSLVRFPSLDDPQWKLLLYHFILHHKLSTRHIQELFGSHHDWIQTTLDELEKSGLITCQSGKMYKLDVVAKYYVEKWLQDLKILNE